MDIKVMRQRLVDAGRLQTERDIEMFEALAEHEPEMLAMIYAASLSGIFVTETDPESSED